MPGSGARAVDLPASQGQDDDSRGSEHDRNVCDVAHEVAAVVDEVDDVTAQEPGLPQEAVDEVTHRTAEHQAKGDRPRARHQVSGDTDDDYHHEEGDEREDPGLPGGEGEGRTGVAHQHQPQSPTEQGRVPSVGQGGERPLLGDLVDDDDDDRNRPQHGDRNAPGSADASVPAFLRSEGLFHRAEGAVRSGRGTVVCVVCGLLQGGGRIDVVWHKAFSHCAQKRSDDG